MPVDPGHLVVLAVGIVVTVLGAAELVAREQHRGAGGEEYGGQQSALHACARGFDRRVSGGTLHSPVAAEIGGMAVAVAVEVRLVMTLHIADDVAQREAI